MQYEMLYSFMKTHIPSNSADRLYHWLQKVLDTVNKEYDMCITINYTSYAHNTMHRWTDTCTLDDSVAVLDLNHTVIYVSDDDDEGDGLDDFLRAHSIDRLNIWTPMIAEATTRASELRMYGFDMSFARILGRYLVQPPSKQPKIKRCLVCLSSLQGTSMEAHIENGICRQ